MLKSRGKEYTRKRNERKPGAMWKKMRDQNRKREIFYKVVGLQVRRWYIARRGQ